VARSEAEEDDEGEVVGERERGGGDAGEVDVEKRVDGVVGRRGFSR